MKCQNCGRELRNGARFCIACGAEHDANGQLVGGNKGTVDYNKTMMANDMSRQQGSGIDYNKTMMAGSTGFKQYSGEQYQQNYEQADYSNAAYNYADNTETQVEKKKISPILIICPIIIIIALASMIFGGKEKTKKETVVKEESVAAETTSKVVEESKDNVAKVATASTTEEDDTQKVHIKGYWSADAEYFYIDGVMQKNMWVGNEEYYVGEDGKKVVNTWVDNKYYVDATGRKARNEWIEFSYVGADGEKKIGFYYVGKDGTKVTDKTVDGRYINSEGCYFPEVGENINEPKETKETKKEDVKETTKKTETSVAQTTAQATPYIPPTTAPPAVPAISPTTVTSAAVSPASGIVVAPSVPTTVSPTSAAQSSEVKIVSTEKVIDSYDGDEYECVITLLKPKLTGADEDETENINTSMEDIMDAWYEDVLGVVQEYETLPKSVTFTSASLGTVSKSKILINMTGSIKPKSGSSKSIKYRITYDRAEGTSDLTQTK